MRLSRLIIAAAPVALVAAAPSTPLAQVSAHLKAVDTMTASFTQTGRDGKLLTGTLTLKRPGRIRFQYGKDVPLLIVGDGRALVMIDYQVRQVSRWPIGDSPLGVLLDPDKDLSRFAHVVADAPGGQLLVEARDPRHPEYGTTTIAFRHVATAPGGLMLDGWSVMDAQNNRSTVRLSGQRFHVPVSDAVFRWVDPRPVRPAGKN